MTISSRLLRTACSFSGFVVSLGEALEGSNQTTEIKKALKCFLLSRAFLPSLLHRRYQGSATAVICGWGPSLRAILNSIGPTTVPGWSSRLLLGKPCLEL